MAFRHGKDAYLAIEPTSGAGSASLQIDAYLNDISLSRSFDTAETSAFGTAAKTYVIGMYDATLSTSGMFDETLDDAVTDHLANVDTPFLFEFRANSSAVSATNPKFTGSAYITSYDISPAIGDMVPISLELQITGAVTRATS